MALSQGYINTHTCYKDADHMDILKDSIWSTIQKTTVIGPSEKELIGS